MKLFKAVKWQGMCEIIHTLNNSVELLAQGYICGLIQWGDSNDCACSKNLQRTVETTHRVVSSDFSLGCILILPF